MRVYPRTSRSKNYPRFTQARPHRIGLRCIEDCPHLRKHDGPPVLETEGPRSNQTLVEGVLGQRQASRVVQPMRRLPTPTRAVVLLTRQ